ncbi:MAG: hypothetical protein V1906_01360 [Candidatus Woesearchaeota archaeon]
MKIGFHETMYGKYWDLLAQRGGYQIENHDKPKQFDFTVDASANLGQFVNPAGSKFLLTHLEGVVTMESLCNESAVMEGSLTLFKNSELLYDFKFLAGNEAMHYTGKKVLNFKHPLDSMTILYGSIRRPAAVRNDDNAMASVSFFRLADLPEFMLSFVQCAKLK